MLAVCFKRNQRLPPTLAFLHLRKTLFFSFSLASPLSSTLPITDHRQTQDTHTHTPTKMPVRIPTARTSEVLCFGAAGVSVFAPLYMVLPGAEERLASQTVRWAPRWERNIGFFTPAAERGMQRVKPPVERTVKRIDNRLPLEKMAKNLGGRIERSFVRFTPKPKE